MAIIIIFYAWHLNFYGFLILVVRISLFCVSGCAQNFRAAWDGMRMTLSREQSAAPCWGATTTSSHPVFVVMDPPQGKRSYTFVYFGNLFLCKTIKTRSCGRSSHAQKIYISILLLYIRGWIISC